MVGDLPGFRALGLGRDTPGAILGLDALAMRKRLILVAGEKRVLISAQ